MLGNNIHYTYWAIGLVSRVFTNGPRDPGSIPGWIMPNTQKIVLDTSLLNTQYYKVHIKGKVEQSRKGVVPSPTPQCSSNSKKSLHVALDYSCQLVQLYLHFLYSYDIKYSYLIQIICTQLYGFKYSYLILIIIQFQVIIFISNFLNSFMYPYKLIFKQIYLTHK